jgi:hypothetical protein
VSCSSDAGGQGDRQQPNRKKGQQHHGCERQPDVVGLQRGKRGDSQNQEQTQRRAGEQPAQADAIVVEQARPATEDIQRYQQCHIGLGAIWAVQREQRAKRRPPPGQQASTRADRHLDRPGGDEHAGGQYGRPLTLDRKPDGREPVGQRAGQHDTDQHPPGAGCAGQHQE